MIGELPKVISVAGVDYSIRSDFRDILKILCAFNDNTLTKDEQVYVCLFILYEEFENMPQNDYQEALEKAVLFIDCNVESRQNTPSPRIMDWEQDEHLMFPAINKIAGFETRSHEYLHWWTFVGYYMEISDGIFAQILEIRNKRAKHKKLEKHEREFFSANKDICILRPRLTKEEEEKKELLKKLLD